MGVLGVFNQSVAYQVDSEGIGDCVHCPGLGRGAEGQSRQQTPFLCHMGKAARSSKHQKHSAEMKVAEVSITQLQ